MGYPEKYNPKKRPKRVKRKIKSSRSWFSRMFFPKARKYTKRED